MLNNRLYKHHYLAGDQYTIADMICYPWTINWKFQGQDIEEFKHFKRWFEEMGARPAVQKGMAVGADLSVDNTKLPPEEQARIRKMLYNQRARPVRRSSPVSFPPWRRRGGGAPSNSNQIGRKPRENRRCSTSPRRAPAPGGWRACRRGRSVCST